MMKKNRIAELDFQLKRFILAYIVVLNIGVTLGLVFVNHTTSMSPEGAVERFRGSEEVDEFGIPESSAKTFYDLLMTTHNHIIGFSFIFFTVGYVFYLTETLPVKLKMFLMIEPFFSIIFSFGSIWGIKYIDPNFVIITITSAILLYLSFYVMSFVIIKELLSGDSSG